MNQQPGFESRGTVKDAHSPAGQSFYAPPSNADLPDCPVCKYGTPMESKHGWQCIDCGARFAKDQIKR
jgi:hypothetical protein